MSIHAPVRQMAEAVERHGGDMEDVRDLLLAWERLHGGIKAANELFSAGKHDEAEKLWKQLEERFAKPLDDLAADRMRARRTDQ